MLFNIHPFLRRGQQVDKGEMEHFKHYLETKGADLSKTTEFLPYYALPYMTKPQDNQAFKNLFTKEWPSELRKKLVIYAKRVIADNEIPVLIQMYHAYARNSSGTANVTPTSAMMESPMKDVSGYINYVNQLENNNKELLHIVEEFNVKYGNLQKDYNILTKKEELAKVNLIDSQTKWSSFAKELLAMSKTVHSELFYRIFTCLVAASYGRVPVCLCHFDQGRWIVE